MTPRHRVPIVPEYEPVPAPVGGGLRAVVRPRSIRTKLIRILVVSLLLAAVLLGLMVTEQIGNFTSASRFTREVTVTLAVQDAVHQLQKERGLTNGYLSGGTQFQGQIAPQRTLTNQALTALNTVIANPDNADSGAPQVRTALGQLADLGSVRSSVDNGQAQAKPTFSFYTNAIGALNDLQLGLDQATDSTLRHGLQTLYALGDAKEFTGQERGLLNGVFAADKFAAGSYQQFNTILGEKDAALATFARFATPTEQSELNTALSSPSAGAGTGDENIALAATTGQLAAPVNATDWWDSMTTVINDLRTVQQSVGADVTARAVQLRDDASRNLMLISILALLAIGVEVALVIGASRSIIGPLSALAGDAEDIARRRLPAAVNALQTATELDDDTVAPMSAVDVPERAGTEIHQVAAALDRVRGTALSLASEQALIRRNTTLSLANLGRRNQNLVRRQLSLISEFEREELDPSALANMFELDHLATRMRRNAESLLVLVGDVSPRPWAEPLPVSDVIRAALSEVEGYRRVTLRRIDDGYLNGNAVTEIAHMLAELVENGLAFSPPDIEVEIYGRRSGNGYLLAVVDAGVGMTQEAIASANARLRDEENYLVAPTRFLGHYVVGRLARPLGIEVRLTESPVTGITARLTLPADLLADRPKTLPTTHPVSRPRELDLARDKFVLTNDVSGPIAVSTGPSTPRTAPVPAASMTPVTSMPPISAAEVAWPPSDELDTAPATHQPPVPPVAANPAPGLGNAYRAAYDPPYESNGNGRNGHHGASDAAPVPSAPLPEPESTPITLERTRNGLVKRQRRGNPAAKAAPTQPGPRRPTADPSLSNRSPEEVGSMLSSFHHGHKRGEGGAHTLRADQSDLAE